MGTMDSMPFGTLVEHPMWKARHSAQIIEHHIWRACHLAQFMEHHVWKARHLAQFIKHTRSLWGARNFVQLQNMADESISYGTSLLTP
jgi:hypothetical protein